MPNFLFFSDLTVLLLRKCKQGLKDSPNLSTSRIGLERPDFQISVVRRCASGTGFERPNFRNNVVRACTSSIGFAHRQVRICVLQKTVVAAVAGVEKFESASLERDPGAETFEKTASSEPVAGTVVAALPASRILNPCNPNAIPAR